MYKIMKKVCEAAEFVAFPLAGVYDWFYGEQDESPEAKTYWRLEVASKLPTLLFFNLANIIIFASAACHDSSVDTFPTDHFTEALEANTTSLMGDFFDTL